MFSRGWSRLLVLSFTALFTTFGTMQLWTSPVSAVGTRTLTPADTRALIGDTIPAQYYDGSAMVDFSFSYGGTATLGALLADGSPSLTFAQGDTVIWYSAQVSPVANPQYITVDVCPRYSFFDTDIVEQMCGLTCGTIPAVSAYSPPSWRWHTSYSGDLIVENQLTANNAYYAICDISINNTNQHITFVDVSLSQQADFSAYSDRALFYGNGAVNGTVYFVVSCPTIADTSTMASGTDIGTTGTGDVNITVDVDMTETNGLLGSLLDVLEGIVDAIAGLFVPSEEALSDFEDELQTLLEEHLGGLYEANQAVLSYAETLIDADTTAQDTILFPAISIPLVGANFVFGPYNVPLIRQDFSVVFDALALVVDIIVTTSFLNMCRKKLILFLHPDGEVISE